MRRRAAKTSTVFQLNKLADKSKITAAAKRKLNQREYSRGDVFIDSPPISTLVTTSIEPIPRCGEFKSR
jgi:hypothetical protein